MQIKHVDGWVINNENKDKWYAVNAKDSRSLGPFNEWQEAVKAADEADKKREGGV